MTEPFRLLIKSHGANICANDGKRKWLRQRKKATTTTKKKEQTQKQSRKHANNNIQINWYLLTIGKSS